MSDVQISVITVNYYSEDLVLKCISSLKRFVKPRIEVIVVDNGSRDGGLDGVVKGSEADGLRSVRILRAGRNLGFGAANNLGAASATGEWLHFLNPDTEALEGLNESYQSLIECGRRDCAYVTSLFDRDGQRVKSWHWIPTVRNYLQVLRNPEKAGRWYLGASVIVPRPVFEDLGGWASDYFMFSEDLDLFYRLMLEGVDVIELPGGVLHDGGGATSRVWSDEHRLVQVERAARSFYEKHTGWTDYYCVTLVQLIRLAAKEPRHALRRLKALRKAGEPFERPAI